jgi:hypothetical protein
LTLFQRYTLAFLFPDHLGATSAKWIFTQFLEHFPEHPREPRRALKDLFNLTKGPKPILRVHSSMLFDKAILNIPWCRGELAEIYTEAGHQATEARALNSLSISWNTGSSRFDPKLRESPFSLRIAIGDFSTEARAYFQKKYFEQEWTPYFEIVEATEETLHLIYHVRGKDGHLEPVYLF